MSGIEECLEVPVAPVFLQDGPASTIHAAVSAGVPGLSPRELRQLARRVPYLFVSQVPDAAKPNRRALNWFHKDVQEDHNILESPLAACVVHQECGAQTYTPPPPPSPLPPPRREETKRREGKGRTREVGVVYAL